MGKWLYIGGVPNPGPAGRANRRALGPLEPSRWVGAAARYLGRDVCYVDMFGFQREIIAATQPVDGSFLDYVESQARENRGGSVDVAFHLIIRDPDGSVRGTELESYNPYFGCKVGYLEWCGESVILIYREKHRTYLCRNGVSDSGEFVVIGDDWVVEGKVVTHRPGKAATVRRLALPELAELPPIPGGEVIAS